MSTLKVLSKSLKYGLLKQADWATPAGASADFKTQNWDRGVTIPDGDVFIDDANESGQYGIHKEAEQFIVDSKTGLPKMSFSGRASKAILADYFAAALQVVTEGATAPFDKAITCGGLSSPIDFAGDAGILYSVAIDNTGTDDGIILENAILNTLKMTIDFNGQGKARNLLLDGEWVGNKLNYEQTLSGSWAAKPTSGYFNDTDTFSASVFTINGVDYKAECIKRFELEINNNVSTNCRTSAGKAGQFDISPVYTVRLYLNYSTVTEKIPNQYGQGGVVACTFLNNVTADADGELGFVIPRAYLTKEPMAYDGDFLAIEVEAEARSLAGASPITVNFTDGVDGGFLKG